MVDAVDKTTDLNGTIDETTVDFSVLAERPATSIDPRMFQTLFHTG